jgi:hypothetical protein
MKRSTYGDWVINVFGFDYVGAGSLMTPSGLGCCRYLTNMHDAWRVDDPQAALELN